MNSCTPVDNVLDELLTLLKLEKIEENIYRGNSQDLGFGNVFGGQVLGQALSAATRTVNQTEKTDKTGKTDKIRGAHSLHAYFMRPGDPAKPIVYQVDCIRDGKSFTTRRVVAIQKGRAILSMSASFHTNETGFEHQEPMPKNIPGPEGLLSEVELARQISDKIPASIRNQILCTKPIEIRPVNPMNPFAPKKEPPDRYVWFKTIHAMPEDLSVHKYMLAYASDFGLVSTSLRPHGRTFWNPDMQVASLDHAMWFHREFRMDDWLLYVMHSPNAGRARGLNHGRIYTRDGILVASTVQEGLIRYRG